MKYDEENRLIKESDIAGSETTTYDTFGNVATVTKKDGTTITQEYDALHRITKQNERTFAYDEQNNQIEATNDDGTLRTEYDAYGNITSTTDPNKNIVRYTYDTFGNKEHIIYPNDEIVTYTYNDQDQVLSVRSDNHVLAQYEYDKRGNVKTLTQDNVVTSYIYDNANRTIHYLTKKDGNVTQNQSYAFDANGNVIEEKQNGVTNTYQYNEVDELKQSTKTIHDKQITTTYSHDLYGNRLEKKDDGSYQISNYNDKNQLTSIDSDKGTTYLHYDAIGNIDSIKYEDGFSERYTYDAFNQLIEIKNNEDKIVHYTYDATGERIETLLEDKETYQTKSYYTEEGKLDFPDVNDRVNSDDINEAFEVAKRQAEIKQANGNQCTITSNHYNLSEYTNEDEYSEVVLDRTTPYSQVLMQDGDTIYYGINRLEREGTKYIAGLNNTITQTITDNKVTTYEYDDYGYSDDIKSGFGYNGEYQEATGLINLRARYYNPRLGRFIQIDSYKGEDTKLSTKNRYTYVGNNPYKYTDPSGHLFWEVFAGVVLLAGAIAYGAYSVFNKPISVPKLKNPLEGIINTIEQPTYRLPVTPSLPKTSYVFTPNVKQPTLAQQFSYAPAPPMPVPCPPINPDELLKNKALDDVNAATHGMMYTLGLDEAVNNVMDKVEAKESISKKTNSHHIVAKAAKNYGAPQSRSILKDVGINVEYGKENRVDLAAGFHLSLHTNSYYASVYNYLRQAEHKKDYTLVCRLLNDIRSILIAANYTIMQYL